MTVMVFVLGLLLGGFIGFMVAVLCVASGKTDEKQVPKQPLFDEECLDFRCPTCGELLTDRIPFKRSTFYFHCLNCGQKFDWGGRNDKNIRNRQC